MDFRKSPSVLLLNQNIKPDWGRRMIMIETHFAADAFRGAREPQRLRDGHLTRHFASNWNSRWLTVRSVSNTYLMVPITVTSKGSDPAGNGAPGTAVSVPLLELMLNPQRSIASTK